MGSSVGFGGVACKGRGSAANPNSTSSGGWRRSQQTPQEQNARFGGLDPKSEAASAIEDRLEADPELAASVEAWAAWLEVERSRPPAFPERAEKAEKRFARTLEKYLKKNTEGPGRARARTWLERYAEID